MRTKEFGQFLRLTAISFVTYACLTTEQATAGKAASKPGVVGTTRFNGKQFNKNKKFGTHVESTTAYISTAAVGYPLKDGDELKFLLYLQDFLDTRRALTIQANASGNKTLTAARRLNNFLFQDYDSTLLPVKNYNDNIHVDVDLTYRQVLDLDEKNQILKSLVWLRYEWTDQHLTWKPVQFDGIEEIEVPCNRIWMPDLVIYEEIGIQDYTARLPKLKVSYNGVVKFKEPCAFETTCSMDTAFFPFDEQICPLTFVMWLQPVTVVDLTMSKDVLKFQADTMHYFVKTGEWQVCNISATKTVQDYGDLFSNKQSKSINNEAKTKQNLSNHIMNDVKQRIMPPHQFAVDGLKGEKLTNTMYAELRFTITVRRNSSLYMQSMLFPSILLTTIAILGFYLPPDSGERIGLQITILLTFMVFLLAVGEMFPASTGPYLGKYFVLCMGLLGLNLAMTVVVLHLHFKPVIDVNFDVESKCKQENWQQTNIFGSYACCRRALKKKQRANNYSNKQSIKKKKSKSAIPRRLRRFLQFCNHYWSVKEKNARWMYVTSDEEENDDDLVKKDNSEDEISSLAEEESRTPPLYDQSWTHSRREKIVKIENEIPSITVTTPSFSNKTSDLSTQRKFCSESHIPQFYNENLATSSGRTFTADQKEYNHLTNMGQGFEKNESFVAENKPKRRKSNHSLKFPMMSTLSDIKEYKKKHDAIRRKKGMLKKRRKSSLKKRLKDERQERIDTQQEEWKSVARAIDVIFFRLYTICIIASHATLFGVALSKWFADNRF